MVSGEIRPCSKCRPSSGVQCLKPMKVVGSSSRRLFCSGTRTADRRDKNRVEEVGLFLFEDCVITAHHKKNGKWTLRQSLFLDNVTVR